MNSYFEELFPPTAISGMKQVNKNMNLFQTSMEQILNFQNLLYQGIKTLANKYDSLKNEINFVNNQLLNIDDSVQNYLVRNPIQAFTKDGKPIDDALDDISDKIQILYGRLSKAEKNDEKFKNFMEFSVSHNEIIEIKEKIDQNSTLINTQSTMIQDIQESISKQEEKNEEKLSSIKELINSQQIENELKQDRKVDKEDLTGYITIAQIAELVQLFKSIPQSKQVKIVEIIPQIFSDTKLTNEEKVAKCYEMLNVERNRVIKEESECKMEFSSLRKLAKDYATSSEEIGPDAFQKADVRDVGCDSGVVEFGEVQSTMILRKCRHRSIACDFKGPLNVICEYEPDQLELIENIDNNYDHTAASKSSDALTITNNVMGQVRLMIEDKITDLILSVGHSLDKSDIVAIIKGLKDVDKMKSEISTMKVTLNNKMDRGAALQAHEQFVKREEFFQFIENGSYKTHSLSASTKEHLQQQNIRSRNAKTAMSQRKKIELKSPLPLVPSRNSKMLGVNDKYAIGDDGKTYFKEFSDSPGLVSTSRSTKQTYYQRSRKSMEQNGVETVIDFQPFVPLKSNEKFELDLSKV